MTPVADAVGFVDGKGVNFNFLGELQKTRREQTLRRDEQQAITAGGELFLSLVDGMRRHAAIERRRRIAALAQAVDLIFHQRNQRRDDDIGAARQRRRDLIAKRFAAAGGQHDQRVALFQAGANRLLLERPQLAVTPVALYGGDDVGRGVVFRCAHVIQWMSKSMHYAIGRVNAEGSDGISPPDRVYSQLALC